MFAVIGTLRPRFLALTPACLFPAVILAAIDAGGALPVAAIVLVFSGALAAHMSVNAFNEYFDFCSGLDHATRRTPFSGGSGTLVAHPQLAKLTLLLAMVSFGAALVIGLNFVWLRGTALLPLGILGATLVYTYTSVITRIPSLCLIAAGLGFGPVMVGGGYIALTGSYSNGALLLSVPVFCVVNNLLLVNQLPDIDADREAGRKTWPMGKSRAQVALMYAGFNLLAILALSVGIVSGLLPAGVVAGIVMPVAGFRVAWKLYSGSGPADSLLPLMKLNVVITLLTPVLMGAGMWVYH